jgi:hypothetical protein
MHIAGAALALLAADAVFARFFSDRFQGLFLDALRSQAPVRIECEGIRIHPLFLSVSAENIKISGSEKPAQKLLYARDVLARLEPLPPLFRREVRLSSLTFRKFR